jgi:hypothetical protein
VKPCPDTKQTSEQLARSEVANEDAIGGKKVVAS